MMRQNAAFWSDNWWIEADTAWFISGEEQILFQYSFIDNKCIVLSQIPVECENKGRLYSRCVKYNTDIVCIPDRGRYIWIYSLQNQSWENIEIYNPNNVRVAGVQFEKIENNLFIFAKGLKEIIKFDLIRKEIVCYIDLSNNTNEMLGFGTFFNNLFYVVSCTFSRVYECNLTTQIIRTFELSRVDDELNIICYGKGKFFICGNKRRIYVWDKEKAKLDEIHSFPSEFGEYNFDMTNDQLVDYDVQECKERIFYCSMSVGRYVWFVPFQTNKILYYDEKTNKLNEYKLPDEEETEYSLNNHLLGHKYLLEYVRENRYIGLYSLKNEWLIEIDAEKLTYRLLPLEIDNLCLKILENKIFSERRKIDRYVYSKLLYALQQNEKEESEIMGKVIYGVISSIPKGAVEFHLINES